MIRCLTTVILGLFFLAGSCILPLGDFSLMNDLPSMYKNYCKVTKEEPDVLDFIGDYLMGGKDLLGHNRGDKPASSASPIQYRHQAGISLFYAVQPIQLTVKTEPAAVEYPNCPQTLHLSEYHGKLLRPPLA